MAPGYSKRGTREQIERDDYEEAIFSSIALGYHAEANKVLGDLHNRLQGVFGATGENQIVGQSGPTGTTSRLDRHTFPPKRAADMSKGIGKPLNVNQTIRPQTK